MQLVILADKRGWHVEDLMRAAAARGHDARVTAWRALRAGVGNAGPVVSADDLTLEKVEVVIARTMPAGTLEQVVFRMDVLHHLVNRGVTVINPPRAIETAVDKYLALWRMQAADLPVPRTIACQSPADALAAFDALGRDVVLKSIFGSEGFGLMRLTDRAAAERVFHALGRMGSILYVQQFITIAKDLRLFVTDGEVIATMRRVGDGWPHNIARGGKGQACRVDDSIEDLALRAASACGAFVAGVDVLIDTQGHPYVLEVNAAPGWRTLSEVCDVDIAKRIIEFSETRAGAECHV